MHLFGIPLLMSVCFSSGLLLRYTPFKEIVGKKENKRLFVGYLVACILNTLVMTVVFLHHEKSMKVVEADMLLFGAVTALWNILIIRGHTREHLFTFGLILCCNYLIVSIPTFLISRLMQAQTEQNYYIIIGLCALLLFIFYLPVRFLLRRTVTPFLALESQDYWKSIWSIPLCMFLAMIFAYPEDLSEITLPHMCSRALLGLILVLLSLGISNSRKRIEQQTQMQSQLNDQQVLYAQMQQRVEDARIQQHDLKHHIAAIQHFIDTDDKQGLQEYANQSFAQRITDVPIPYTGNAAADGVVYRYMQLAQQNNVAFHYAGKIYSSGISDMDLCVLLGNALDNALTACLTIPANRSISLVSKKEDGLLSIMVHNTFDGKIEQTDSTFLSRKRDKVPGVGMQSMQTICNRYNGILQTSWDEGTFSIIFLLPIQ